MNTIKKTSQTISESNSDSVTIVGVGASAGGLEAFKHFLENLPIDTGLAYVLVQHLDPNHESLSTDILSRSTKMPVTEAKDKMKIESNHVYMIPPGFCMGVSNSELKLHPRGDSHKHQRVIDFFLRELAEDRKENAIGIVLSGTGNDGSEGLVAIKAAGGITFAQSLTSAKFDEMPKNAIATMAVDLILTPQEIANELANIAIKLPQEVVKAFDLDENEAVAGEHLNKIFLLLRNVCHVDFTYYKSNTILRRLARRMTLHRMESIEDYANYLLKNPEEVKALYADILIHVTQFFRDPEAYESLIRDIFPKLIENRPPGLPIRIWVPACSTGEEVYSLAIAFSEFLSDKAPNTAFQIFASDVSERAIQKARAGEYSENISQVVSSERMKRFFTKSDSGHYKVNKSIRDVCLFSRHDLTVDPPFAKIDLISCRNLLIYLTNVLQKHVMPLFHYSLVPKGYLWLGKSETVGGFTNLFSLIDKANKTYARKDAPNKISLQFPASTYVPGNQHFARKTPSFVKPTVDIPKIADLALQ
nr:hypothetical protein [Bdellovibrionales bacterium]